MNWKEFFKPSVAKVILFILLGILTSFSYFSVHRTVFCIEGPCPQPFPYGNLLFILIFYTLGLPFVFAEYLNKFIPPIVDSAIFILGIILNIIYLYIIACIISYYFKSIILKYKK